MIQTSRKMENDGTVVVSGSTVVARNSTGVQPIKENKPALKSLVKCKLADDNEEWRMLRIDSRGGRANGRNQNWFNVYDNEKEGKGMFSVNWDKVEEWSTVAEEICMSARAVAPDDPVVLEAKHLELEKWKQFEVYNEVRNEGQTYITVQWVLTQKVICLT